MCKNVHKDFLKKRKRSESRENVPGGEHRYIQGTPTSVQMQKYQFGFSGKNTTLGSSAEALGIRLPTAALPFTSCSVAPGLVTLATQSFPTSE